jgi:hypothetical protein
MARRLTTNNLINDIRSLIDEHNQVSIDDKTDILPALNRAQDVASNILARHYESPLLAYTLQYLQPGVREYQIPRDAFEQRLEKIEVQIQNGLFNPVKRQSYRDATLLETTARTAFPLFYSEIGDMYRLYPSPTGAYPLRIWYNKDPEPLVQEQGTITDLPSKLPSGLYESRYVVVSDIGGDLTTEEGLFTSYVNFVDGFTGRIKGTCQIFNITTNTVTFKATPDRTEVLGHSVSGALPPDLALDDLICTVEGNCISVLKKPFANYLISMAASELLNTKLGIPNEMAEKVRKEMEKLVQESWVGRENYARVRSASPHWERIGRRYGNRF